jgi:hypothetical protein
VKQEVKFKVKPEVKPYVRPDITRPPSKAALTAAAYRVLRLPALEESPEYGLAHFLGTVLIARNDAVLDAVLDLWLTRVRASLKYYRALTPTNWHTNYKAFELSPEEQRCNFYRFHEYLDAVKDQKPTSKSPAYSWPKPYNSMVHDRFKTAFSARRYTPDRRGYRRYLNDQAPAQIKNFITKPLPVCLPDESHRLNSYIFAAPRAGKSELLKLLVHAELRRNRPTAAIIVLDVAGDLANELRFREFARDDSRLVFINPVLDLQHTPCLNPFEVSGTFADIEEEKDAKEKQADQIFSALDQALRDAPEGAGFSMQMIGVVKPAIRALLDVPRASFVELVHLMEGDPKLVERCQRCTDEDVADFFQRSFLLESYNRSRDGIAARLQATFLAESKFKALTNGESTIPLEDLIEQRKIIIFNLAKGAIGKSVAHAFGRFVLAAIYAIGYRRERTEKAGRTVTHIIIDEFQNYITDSVFEAIEELRKFNIRQTLAQPSYLGDMGPKQQAKFKTGVQGAYFIGKCGTRSVAANAASEIGGIDLDELIELTEAKERAGDFFVRSQGRPTFLLHSDDRLLNETNTLSETEWEPLKRRQLATYYRPKKTPSPRQNERDTDPPVQSEAPQDAQRAAPSVVHAGSSRPAKTAKAERSPFASKPPRQPPPPEPE